MAQVEVPTVNVMEVALDSPALLGGDSENTMLVPAVPLLRLAVSPTEDVADQFHVTDALAVTVNDATPSSAKL